MALIVIRSRKSIWIRAAVLASCAALAVAGCSSDDESTTSSSSTTTTSANSALKDIDPAAFQSAIEAAANELKVPGALVLVRTPEGETVASVGTTELGTQTAPEKDTHVRIASNTKTMTSALIVLLAQDGKLKFSDPVSDYVPGVPNGENITIANLLKMRSGLYNYTMDPAVGAVMDSDPGKAWTPQEALDIAFSHPPNFAPDAEYEYNNTNYALLGLVAEKVGGQPLQQQLQERLYGPHGLTETSVPLNTDTSIPSVFSNGYMYGGSYYALADVPYPADIQSGAEAGTLQPIDYTHQNPSYATAAGGAISTADDMANWMEALVSGKVFNAEYQQQWVDSRQLEVPDDQDNPYAKEYGYGISYQHFGPNAPMFYHGGELPGFNSFMGYDPENDVTLVIWTNLTLSPEGQTTAQGMLATVVDEIYQGLNLVPPPTETPTPTS
ncbi:serine hydrolase domain-containing protein [Aldersonia kunmingensis]|uniref:serine hydrolase domain-containing protein n=1 Tax=Aldersonia kunmingensis TaxID=408066 RepID=UPI00083434A6|nr:serine hydrolase domain-containing protein [Aldersonia kunmingensis]